jgi:phage terminase Nu1 subunit (DNA packaging protein)
MAHPSQLIVNVSELADLYGAGRMTVQGWIKSGLPLKGARSSARSHEIELGAAVRWVRAHDLSVWEEKVKAARDVTQKQKALTRKAIAEAELAELDVAERKGELVPAAAVASKWDSIALSVKEAVLAIASRAVQEGVIDADHEGQLDLLCRDALRDIAGG